LAIVWRGYAGRDLNHATLAADNGRQQSGENTVAYESEVNEGVQMTSGVPRGAFGVFKPPPPEIPKISVETSIAQARRTGVSISFCSSLCYHTVVIY